jgi:hypothetical protein
MANTLLNTEMGRKLFETIGAAGLASATFTDRSAFLNPDPWPLFVRYAGEKATFVPRDRYYFADPAGPSACLWIVPGSTR